MSIEHTSNQIKARKVTPAMDNEDDLYEVVISGISGKFPLSDDVEQLKENLLSKRYLVTEENCRWDKEKWKVPSATGKISVIKKFDDTFFGIYSGLAGMMDPLTRVTIERAFEAIMDAGINPKTLRGSSTAVFTASSTSDSEAVGCDEKLTARFWLLAHVRALLANRISYVLNLNGPSWNLDATWIGGIECLKRAADDIRRGRIENALVGVSNVILFPEMSQHWMGLGKLSSDGSCFPFDEDANGYGRSEAVIFLFLQREKDANRVYAKVTQVDAMFCGDEADTFLKPKKEAFVNFLEKFYSTSNVPRKDVAYLEAYGSADKYMDELELNSVGEVLCDGRENGQLYVGSVKSNLGHAEAAAPFVSLTKMLISLDSGIIPPNRNLRKLNKNISKLYSNDMKFLTNASQFPENQFAAVNAIGLSTSIGHVLLQQHPKKKTIEKSNLLPRLVLLSSRNEAGLLHIIDKLESVPYDAEYFAMVNNVFRESMTGHFFRGFSIRGTTEKKIRYTLETGTPLKRQIWFVFAGMGSQCPGMGAELMNIPVFAAAIKEIDSYLAPLGIDIINVISSYDPVVLKNVVHCFVGIVAIQIGLVDILRAVGIEPDGMFGHSLGENLCAYADGCFTKYQCIMAAYYRGKASSEVHVQKGLMAAVGLNYAKLPNLPPNVEIACHNANDNTTISGPLEEVQLYVEELKQQNIFVRVVNSNNVAYHSKQVHPLVPFVLENIRKVVPNPVKRTSRWISTSIPEHDWDSPLAETSSAEYHAHNFSGTVYFAEACAHVPEDAAVIEISPHGLFQGILKRMLPESCFIVPLGKRETSSSLNFLLTSIGKLFAVGLQPDVNALYPPIEYPVSRGTLGLANLATWNHDTDWNVTKYHNEVKIKPLKVNLREPKWKFLTGYKMNEKVILPFPILLVETLQAYNVNGPVLVFEDVNIPNFAEVCASEITTIYTQVQYGSGRFETVNDDKVLINGVVRYEQDSIPSLANEEQSEDDDVDQEDRIVFTSTEIREVFKQYSMDFSELLVSISSIVFTEDGCLATIIWNDNLAYFINAIAHVKMFWDLCFSNVGPLLASSFLRFATETKKYSGMKPGMPVKMVYYKNRNIFVGPGFEMVGLENSYQQPLSKERQLMCQDLQFVQHDNPQTMNLETFLNFCGQIVGETFSAAIESGQYERPSSVKCLLMNDLNGDKEFKTNITLLFDTLYRELPHSLIDAKYASCKDLKNICKNGSKYGKYFIICNVAELCSEEISQLVSYVEDAFLLTFSKVSKAPNNFVKITGKNIEKYDIVLWKKKAPMVDCVMKIKPSHNEHWLEDLEEDLRIIRLPKQVLVQWHSTSVTDILDVICRISTIQPIHILRYLIIMDKDSSPENTEDDLPQYRQQLEKGVIMNVYKDAQWGSLRYLIVTESLTPASEIQFFASKCKKIENLNIEYVAVCGSSCSTASQNKTIELCEFSATTSTDQKRVMGIANFQTERPNAEILFQWSIPEQWSLEDAVTVPFAFLKAYYALIVKGKLCSRSSVLVHSGCTVLGETAIAITLSFDCLVYTSVDNVNEIKYLRERFSNSSRLIFLPVKSQVDVEILKLTRGEGVDLVINADSPRQVQLSLHCLKYFGSLLLLSDSPLLTKSTFGMDVFLKSTSIHSIMDMDVLRYEEGVKNEMHSRLLDSMKSGVIKPFKRVLCQSNDVNLINNPFNTAEKISRVIIKQEMNSTTHSDVLFCDPESCYLIIGDKSEIWFGIVTWLLEHNAKKLVFIEDEKSDFDNQYQKRFGLFLQNYPDLYMMHMSASTIRYKDDAATMIRDVHNFANLDVVFCLSMDSEKCSFIDYGLRKYAPNARQLICLQCDASKICESRLQNSLPALNVIWDRSITDAVILIKNIRKITENSLRIKSSLIYISDTSQYAGKLEYSLLNKESQFFPQYSEMKYFLQSFSEKGGFVKAVSKCPSYSTRTQLFPIFILPGLHWHRLKKIIRKLMYPVFCAKFPATYSTASHVAKSLVEPLKEIQPNGPYTIVGESWSGAVAMELVSLLEKENPENKVKLILLEGIPKDMRDRLSSMGSFGSREFLDSLDERCSQSEEIDEDRRSESTRNTVGKERAQFLELLQLKLATTYHYSSENAFIQSDVVAIKLTNKSTLNTYIDFEKRYGQKLELRMLDENEYNELINSDVAANIINDHVLFKW